MFSFQNSNAKGRKHAFSGVAPRTKLIYGGFIVPEFRQLKIEMVLGLIAVVEPFLKCFSHSMLFSLDVNIRPDKEYKETALVFYMDKIQTLEQTVQIVMWSVLFFLSNVN